LAQWRGEARSAGRQVLLSGIWFSVDVVGPEGFSRRGWEALASALRDHAMENNLASAVRTPLGMRYVVEGPVKAPDGRSPNMRSVWFQEGNLPPRLVTAYPLEEKPQ